MNVIAKGLRERREGNRYPVCNIDIFLMLLSVVSEQHKLLDEKYNQFYSNANEINIFMIFGRSKVPK